MFVIHVIQTLSCSRPLFIYLFDLIILLTKDELKFVFHFGAKNNFLKNAQTSVAWGAVECLELYLPVMRIFGQRLTNEIFDIFLVHFAQTCGPKCLTC